MSVHLFSNIFIFVSALSNYDFLDRMADNMKEEKVSIKGEMFSVEDHLLYIYKKKM